MVRKNRAHHQFADCGNRNTFHRCFMLGNWPGVGSTAISITGDLTLRLPWLSSDAKALRESLHLRDMRDHRSKLDVDGIGTWVLNAPRGQAEFIGENDYVPAVQGNLWKFLEGGARPKFVDPQRRFVLLDAQDELLRGDAQSGELKTVATLTRQEDHGLRRSHFIPHPVPIFVFEYGLVIFAPDGDLRWLRNDLKLTDFFQGVEDDRVTYSSEHRGRWAYDLLTGNTIAAE